MEAQWYSTLNAGIAIELSHKISLGVYTGMPQKNYIYKSAIQLTSVELALAHTITKCKAKRSSALLVCPFCGKLNNAVLSGLLVQSGVLFVDFCLVCKKFLTPVKPSMLVK